MGASNNAPNFYRDEAQIDCLLNLIKGIITTPNDEKIQKYGSQLHAYKYALENPNNGKGAIKISKMGVVSVNPESMELKDGKIIGRAVINPWGYSFFFHEWSGVDFGLIISTIKSANLDNLTGFVKISRFLSMKNSSTIISFFTFSNAIIIKRIGAKVCIQRIFLAACCPFFLPESIFYYDQFRQIFFIIC